MPPATSTRPPKPGRGRRRAPWIVGALALVLAAVAWSLVANGMSREDEDTAVRSGSDTTPGFVHRVGTGLVLDGRPYRFLGFNNYVMLGCGNPPENITGPARDDFFATMRPESVVRLSVLPGANLADVDAIVASATQHRQRLIIVLTDAHGYCGDTPKDQAWYESGYRGEYLDWVRTVVPRYAQNPTVAVWELINEPGAVTVPALRAFFDDAGGLVHQLAPHQLVSSGTLQPDTYGGVEAFTELHASPGIDLVSLHEYDDVPAESHHVEPALAAATTVDKPLFVGEWGIYAGPPGARDEQGRPCDTVAERARTAQGKIDAYAADPRIAGALYWSYTAETLSTCKLSTKIGDPLVDLVRDTPLAEVGGS
ncbi:MAG: cellulase family glycosylhydrolase [Pseudonocardia sp.]|nr:cellulase family glycosylhydrolase [Pseudonocardia sp.]